MDFEPLVLNVDWGNDALFYTYEWEDETSQFDDHPSVRWNYGSECYTRKFKARIPIAFRDCEELREQFIMLMTDSYPDVQGFWVD